MIDYVNANYEDDPNYLTIKKTNEMFKEAESEQMKLDNYTP